MSPNDPLHFAVRSLQTSPGLDGAFRVHILPEFLEQVHLKTGDVCEILDEDGSSLGHGIAWRATDRLGTNNPKMKPVKMSETLRTAYGISEGSHVSLRRTTAKPAHAAKVTLTDVTPVSYTEGQDPDYFEDGKWLLRSSYMLGTCEAFASGITFDVSAKKGLKKRFYVENIKSSEKQPGAMSLFSSDYNTEFVVNDSSSSGQSSIESDERGDPIPEEYIGGLLDQLRELNRRMKRVLRQQREATTGFRTNEGVLIHGFEGTGKSLIMKHAEGGNFRKVVCLNKSSLTAGTTTKNQEIVRNAFKEASRNQPSLVLMDDVEKLAPASEFAYTGAIGEELDMLAGSQVLVIAATRSPNDVNNALTKPGRLTALIELSIPDLAAREKILNVALDDSLDPNGQLAQQMSLRTHGFTGQDLAMLVQVAKSKAFDRYEDKYDSWLKSLRENGHLGKHPNGMANGKTDPGTANTVITNGGGAYHTSQTDGPVGFASRNLHGVTTLSNQAADGTIRPELTMEDFEAALTKVRPTALREIIFQSPQVRWEHIGGSEDVKNRFDKILWWPLQHPNIMEQYRKRPKKGVLLYGPPGCSKTLTAQAVASQYGHNFIAIKGAELISMYVGESERSIRDIFRKARQAAPCVIFFDEIDSIASERESGSTKGLNVLTTLLNEMDGFDTLKSVLVLAATNKPDALDPAIMRPGRFDSHLYLGPPNSAARREIFDISTKGLPLEEDMDFNKLIDATEGYSGAEIVKICDLATDEAIERKISSAVPRVGTVGMMDFEKGLAQTKKAITPEMVAAYHSFAAKVSSL